MEVLLGLVAFIVGGVLLMVVMEGAQEALGTWWRRRHVEAYRQNSLMERDTRNTFCLLLRSTQFDIAVTGQGFSSHHQIHDNDTASPLNFRSHLSSTMRPIVVKAAKNAESISEIAAVNYAESEWQNQVLLDMEACGFILLAPHWPSKSLCWEIEQIMKLGLLEKTFVLFPDMGCFQTPPRPATPTIDWRHRAEQELPLETVQKAYGSFGHKAKYDEQIGFLAGRLARESAVWHGWSEAQLLFSTVGLKIPDNIRPGCYIRFVGPERVPSIVSDWMFASGLRLNRTANPIRPKNIGALASFPRRHQ